MGVVGIQFEVGEPLAATGDTDLPIPAEKVERKQGGDGPGRAPQGTWSVYPLAESDTLVALSLSQQTACPRLHVDLSAELSCRSIVQVSS